MQAILGSALRRSALCAACTVALAAVAQAQTSDAVRGVPSEANHFIATPEGWVHPEGPFCEFNRLMGGLHMNPRVRIKSIMHRKDAMYYALQMPWENIWMSAPIYEAAARRVLFEAGVQAKAINVTPGGCCHWHIVASIKKAPGDGKNAIMSLLSIADIKHVTIVDDDIDVFDPVDVEWAVATRVQTDRDVLIVSNARSKPLDPSLPLPVLGKVPTTAKMGIDAGLPVSSDDLNAVRDGVILPLPFTGDLEEDQLHDEPVPLRAVVALHKGDHEELQEMSVAEAASLLVRCAPYVNRDPHVAADLLARAHELAQSVPRFSLTFRRGANVWPILFDRTA